MEKILKIFVSISLLVFILNCEKEEKYIPPEKKLFNRKDCSKIKKGMKEDQVIAISGHPHTTTEADNSKKGRWAWGYEDSITNERCSVTFSDAIVESAEFSKW